MDRAGDRLDQPALNRLLEQPFSQTATESFDVGLPGPSRKCQDVVGLPVLLRFTKRDALHIRRGDHTDVREHACCGAGVV